MDEDEEKYKITFVFFDKPNMRFTLKILGKKINHDAFFSFLAKNENENEKKLQVCFYWQSDGNEESSYGKHLNQLRMKLMAKRIRFESVGTDKDVDLTIINDIFFALISGFPRPEKIILCSGDKSFSVALGMAKEIYSIPITVISGEKNCAEVLKNIAQEIIFIEDMINNNENLFFNYSNVNE